MKDFEKNYENEFEEDDDDEFEEEFENDDDDLIELTFLEELEKRIKDDGPGKYVFYVSEDERYIIKISPLEYYDDFYNPRNSENLGVIASKDYRDFSINEFSTIKKYIDPYNEENIFKPFKKAILDEYNYTHSNFKRNVFYLPIYICSYSSSHISVRIVHSNNDADGFIFTTAKRAREWFGKKRLSKKMKENIYKCLESEIKEFDSYLNDIICQIYVVKEKKSPDSNTYEIVYENYSDSLYIYFKDEIKYIISEIKDDINKNHKIDKRYKNHK